LWIGSLSGQFAGSILNWWTTGSEQSALEKMICVAGAAWSRVDSCSYQEYSEATGLAITSPTRLLGDRDREPPTA
jgi:hypothetical protein